MDTNNVEKVIFKSNENVQFYLRIRNTGKDFTMGKGTCEYGLFHIYKGDSLLGTHLDGVTCINVYTTFFFSHNESIEYTAFWVVYNPVIQHQYLEPGRYRAVVKSAGIYNNDKSEKIVFEKTVEFEVIP
jgi:hypothetical protein